MARCWVQLLMAWPQPTAPSRATTKPPGFIELERSPTHNLRLRLSPASSLASGSGSWQAAKVSSQDFIYTSPPRHDHSVRFHQTVDHSGARSALGTTSGWGQRENARRVPGVGRRQQEAKLESLLWTSGSVSQRICGAITLQSIDTAGPHRGGKGRRSGLQLKPQRKPQGGHGLGGRSQGLVNPGWVARARVSDVDRPTTPSDPR